ncbi:ATP-NAD kinase family protein [Paraferrimonas sedimenticola]|uniref:ATP-NAD kinase n=1 Tax=Paraferrimonas sedimenticola TaxID=375674 RepID=A0AA37W179_9GAMM|nr:ATP-NAD kinase family protein [Paraferrimonas sedimenticola]GLP96583.1 ATP-NAD kinase [Paraferrimonas sedimenticola]
MSAKFRLGIIVNPLAGLGGSVALKGSDGVAEQALALGAKPMAPTRMKAALEKVLPYAKNIEWATGEGALGGELLSELAIDFESVYYSDTQSTSAQDTQALAKALSQWGADLILFAGGDGTARDMYQALSEKQAALGVPAGVKIHSGVYGVSPTAAGAVVAKMARGEMVSLMEADVMDIDEVAFRQGTVRARRYGELHVPAELKYVQAVKMGGVEVDELVLADIAAEAVESMDPDTTYFIGSGSTTAAVMDELGLENTLLGVDAVRDGQLIGSDLTASQLLALTEQGPCKLFVTLIGGQGHVLGRGNQQLSPQLIRTLGRNNIQILATKTKLNALADRPLLVDSGDPQLDRELSGYCKIITGYRDYVMYPLANPE